MTKKLNQQFVEALANFVAQRTGNAFKNWEKIQACIDDLEDQANHEDDYVVTTLLQDPEIPSLLTQAYTHELSIGGEHYRIAAFANKNFIEV